MAVRRGGNEKYVLGLADVQETADRRCCKQNIVMADGNGGVGDVVTYFIIF